MEDVLRNGLRTVALAVVTCCTPLAAAQETASRSHLDDLLAGARAKVQKSPQAADSWVDLANALARRAREKSDPALDSQAEDAINHALRIEPGNFEARKVRVIVRLHQHRFADALEEAQTLNKQIPDENILYGLISDAQFALGNYKEAEASAQRMIDMRQVNAPGLQRGSNIREIIGYTDGAIDWWNSSLRLTTASDQEERAYISVQIARLNRSIGKPGEAARFAEQALGLRPDYPRGLTELALDRLAEEKPAEAAELLRKRLRLSEDLDSRYWLAEALRQAGKPEEAAAAHAEFAKRAQGDSAVEILDRAEHGQAAEAVRLGAEALKKRHDVFTHDAEAWALYLAGDYQAAQKEMELALAPGIRNASFFFHAGMIAKKNNNAAQAAKFLRKSLEVNAGSAEAPAVMRELSAASPASR